MRRREVVLALIAGSAGFVLGVGSTRLLGWGPPAATAPAASSEVLARLQFPGPDAGMRLVMPATGDDEIRDAGPRILFDPDSITLLPDASLRLDLLKDAGKP
jgi:outer membrane protein OmpA-like peptidoglycan-associated protein